MMIINAEQWIITSHDSDEYTYHDPFYPHIENNYRDEYRELDDRVTLLEKVIRTLSIEIEKLNMTGTGKFSSHTLGGTVSL